MFIKYQSLIRSGQCSFLLIILMAYSDVMLSSPYGVKCDLDLVVEVLGADASGLSSSIFHGQCCFLVATSIIWFVVTYLCD